MVDLNPVEKVVDAVADLANLSRRGRVGSDQLIGERAGTDLPGSDLLGAARNLPEDHLGRATADVDDADGAGDRVSEGLGGADEGEPALLLVAEDLALYPGGLADLLRSLLTVRRLPHRSCRDGTDHLGAELTGEPNLGG